MSEQRVCAYVKCFETFIPKRPHQRFCCRDHRYAQWELRKERWDRQRGGQRVERPPRRPSRDGKGTKVYLTFGELVHLQQARGRLEPIPTPAGARLDAKLERACERIPEAVR